MAPEPTSPPVLLERSALLARVERRLWGDGGSGLLLTGPPGVGKRTLALEVAARTERARRRVVRLAAVPGATAIPYAALAPILEGDPADDEHARFLAARSALTGERSSMPLVVVPDIGHLDSRSIAVLAHLVAAGEVRLLATESDAERQKSVAERFEPVGLDELEVPPLDAEESAELVRRTLGGPVDPRLCEDLVQLSDGVPLHLRQLLTSSLDDGIIRREAGWWVAPDGLPRSRSLERLVADELDRLPEAEREAVDVLGVAGQLGVTELGRLVPEAAVDALERRGLVALSYSGRRLQVAFRRPLTAVVAGSRISTLRRRSLSGAVAGAFEEVGGRRREDRLQVVALRVRAGRPQDPGAIAAAAALALEDERCDLAAELALAAGGDQPSGPLEARLTLAHAFSRQGHLDDADAVLAGAEPPPGDEDAWLAIALVTGEHRVWSRGTSAVDATAGLPPAPTARAGATLAAVAAGWAALGGDLADADVVRQEAAAHLAGAPDDTRLANQLRYLDAITAFYRLQGDRGAALATEGLAATEQATTSVAERNPAGFLVAMGLCHLASGRLGEARATFDTGTTIAGRNGVPRGVAFFDVNTAQLGHLDGRVTEMVHAARRVTRLGEELGIAMAGQLGRAHQALALAMTGRLDEAEEVIAAASPPTSPVARFEHARAGAWIAACGGEVAKGAVVLAALADDAETAGLHLLELLARLDLIRLGRGAEQRERTALLAAGAEGALAPAVAAAAAAVAGRHARALLRVVSDLEALGALLVAAELAALGAELHRAAGAGGAAAAAELRCRRLRERCDPVAASPAFAHLAGDERLTDRERELAELAARGWSNADIAASLVLSVRTVENHLQRAYRKLGVRGRGDLPAVLGVGTPD